MIATLPCLASKLRPALVFGVLGALWLAGAACAAASGTLHVDGGSIATVEPDSAGVRSFKGIPFAAPPVGELRWRAPQPVRPWQGALSADTFAPRCMQSARLGNIDPLNPRMSEDCLYLNVWTPAKEASDRLPVMVWFYGGGFNVGAGSEPWYNGVNLAKKGVVVVTLNYRLDVFGFLAHPWLTAESDHHASGNYGLMDQLAALGWVKRNIAAFGGNPDLITAWGESAGSISVSALMASPLSRGLFQRAIGESGSILYPNRSRFAIPSLAKAEQAGRRFVTVFSASSLAELRAKPAEELLKASTKIPRPHLFSIPDIDGYVLPTNAVEVFAKGEQTDVPMLAGSNADEGTLFAGRVQSPPTQQSFVLQVQRLFRDHANAVLKAYPDDTPAQARDSSAKLLGDQLIAYPTWLWNVLQARTGKKRTYRYFFSLRPPGPESSLTPLTAPGVYHSAEILYVFDNLQARDWPWRPEDRRMAEIVSSYWVNFAKSGNPNGPGLPIWPIYAGPKGLVMRLVTEPASGPDPSTFRYQVLNDFYFGDEQR